MGQCCDSNNDINNKLNIKPKPLKEEGQNQPQLKPIILPKLNQHEIYSSSNSSQQEQQLNEINNPYNEPTLKNQYSLGSSLSFDNTATNLSQNQEIEQKSSSYQYVNNISDSTNFNCIKTIEAHDEKIVCIIELSSGKIATGSYDCKIKIWNLYNYECEKSINENGYVFCLLEFEKNMLLSGTNENSIQLWDINNSFGQNLHSFEGHLLWINSLAKCDHKYFASCSNDSDIRIWDYYSKKCKTILKGHYDCVLTLTRLNDGRLCSGSSDLTIKIWNWEQNICDATLTGHTKWVKCVYQLNNGYILSGSDDKTIKIWKEDNILNNLTGHEHSVRSFCQITDNLFASASFDKTIKIWDINSMKCVNTLVGHLSNVFTIIYHSSGCLISCSNDHTIKIWKNT